jgi:hypothetical protein
MVVARHRAHASLRTHQHVRVYLPCIRAWTPSLLKHENLENKKVEGQQVCQHSCLFSSTESGSSSYGRSAMPNFKQNWAKYHPKIVEFATSSVVECLDGACVLICMHVDAGKVHLPRGYPWRYAEFRPGRETPQRVLIRIPNYQRGFC